MVKVNELVFSLVGAWYERSCACLMSATMVVPVFLLIL
jgi:hypothetical protein